MGVILPDCRYTENYIKTDIKEKMVFIGGPRQVGKTTLALHILGTKKGEEHSAYLNWDISKHRKQLMREEFPNEPLIVLDEIHKYRRWRNMLKGFYDQYYPKKHILVTGSARLDYYRKGGDSLQGRYHYYRLHPYSLMEINKNPTQSDLESLLTLGGFPEPLLKSSSQFWRRWQRERLVRILQEDLRDLERVNEISTLEVLLDALPGRVGSPLSLNSLKEDLDVSHDSIRRWLSIFENLYICFRISPYGSKNIRAVKKEKKLYFWDWSLIQTEGYRFENLVASQLLKFCHFKEDTEGFKMDLQYIRDTDKREVDFVVLQNNKPIFAVECKSGEKNRSSAALYFKERTPIPKFYQVHLGKKDYGDEEKNIRVFPFLTFAKELDLP